MTLDFRTVPLEHLADMVRSKEVSSRELVEHALSVVDRGGALNAWVVLDGERALEAAAGIDERLAGGEDVGPLAGIPIGVKDMEHATPFPTRYGSLLTADDPPPPVDSTLTARLRAAGCVVLGKTTTPEHGWTGDTWSPYTGATVNPFDTSRSPGGSSGGTAAALSSGMVPLATGSDGGGSVRNPASICGLASLKPSQGRVPLDGGRPPGAGLLAVRAPMAVHARDVAYAMAAVVGPDPGDCFSLPDTGEDWRVPEDPPLPPRVVWSPAPDFPVDAGVAAACDAAIGRLADAGTAVIVVEQPFNRPPLWDWWVLWTSYRERAQGHLRGTPEWELIDPGLREEMDFSHERVGTVRVMKAFDRIHYHAASVAGLLERAPVLLSPAVASETAFSRRPGTVDGVETHQWSPFTQVYNLTRHPAGIVPCGTTAAGLPIGIQVAGPLHDDVGVLHAMAALESLWADAVPAFPTW